MKKPLGIYFFGILYLILGIFVIVGFIYLVITDFSVFSIGSYNAGDVIYSADSAQFVLKFFLAPCIFIGGVIAIPGVIIILKEDSKYKKQGYYLVLIASVAWTLPIIGLITIWYFLKKDIKDLYLE